VASAPGSYPVPLTVLAGTSAAVALAAPLVLRLVPQEHRLENMSGPGCRSIRNVADQNMIEETARDMAKKTVDDDRLTVELSSDPSALTPGAARAVLRMLLEARDKQTGERAGRRRGAAPE